MCSKHFKLHKYQIMKKCVLKSHVWLKLIVLISLWLNLVYKNTLKGLQILNIKSWCLNYNVIKLKLVYKKSLFSQKPESLFLNNWLRQRKNCLTKKFMIILILINLFIQPWFATFVSIFKQVSLPLFDFVILWWLSIRMIEVVLLKF